MKSIECDSSFASGYQKISALYSRAKKEDSALAILQKCVAVNPRNAEAFRNLGKYYLNNGRDTVQAEINFKKAISLDSSGYDNYNELAMLYRKQKDKDKAIGIYKEALGKLGKKKDLFNELGNTYFEAPSAFDTAITWYKKALEIDSTLDYVYFNLGKLYDIKDIAKDSSIYYYSRAVFYDPDRFDKVNYTIDKYYNDNKNYDRAKFFYWQVLDIGTAKKFWLNRYLGRLVQILIKENNFAEAENALKQYLNPASDKDLYTKLSKAIDEGRINAAQK